MRRIVVTGVGAVSAYGLGVDALWRGLSSGEAAIGAVDVFDPTAHRTSVGGQVPRESALRAAAFARGRGRARLTRTDRFALEAASEALGDAGLASPASAALLAGAGVFFGSSTGGTLEGERVLLDLLRVEPGERVPRHFSRLSAQPVCGPSEALARTFGIDGPVETIASACAAATMAIEAAVLGLRSGEIEVALAGGSDSLCELTYGGFNALRAVDQMPARPFRKDRAGLSLGEGAGVLVLETFEHAKARGARFAVELAGTGSSCDAFHMTAPDPAGSGAARAMQIALDDAGVGPHEIDFVNAHGTGTPHNDDAEWNALRQVFGERAGAIPLTSTKGAVGHLLGACGALEAVATACCLFHGRVHPTPGDGPLDEQCPVDLVLGRPRVVEPCRLALSVNLAFGGANAALVLRRSQAPGARG